MGSNFETYMVNLIFTSIFLCYILPLLILFVGVALASYFISKGERLTVIWPLPLALLLLAVGCFVVFNFTFSSTISKWLIVLLHYGLPVAFLAGGLIYGARLIRPQKKQKELWLTSIGLIILATSCFIFFSFLYK